MNFDFNWRQRWTQILRKWLAFKERAKLGFHYLQDEIYEIDKATHSYFRALTILLSLLVVASILIPIGFEMTPELIHLNRQIETVILFGFVASFLLRLFFTTNRITFLKKRWIEGIFTLISIFILAGIVDILFFQAGLTERILLQFLKGYLLLIVVIKFLQYLPELLEKQKNSARFLVYSFLSLIASGTVLLMLPEATQDGEGLNFIDALFTSTSAVCITGLIVVDTATHFTLFGELVILTLIQLGGIGIVTFATFLFLYLHGGLGLGQMNTLKGMVGEKNSVLLISTLKMIVGFTLLVEAIGAVAFYLSWDISFSSHEQKILFSIFHAVSAFCNAGFSLFTNSFADAENATNLGVNFTTMILIVLGGLGFTTIWEIIRLKTARSKWRRRLTIHTRTVLLSTVVLIVIGTLLILAMEWNQTLSSYSLGNKVLISLFQSITTRTAGFNTIDTGAIGMSATLIILVLMFIGGSPASTAGGIKTTTFAVVMRSVVMTIRGYNRMEVFNRTVPNSVIFRAMTVALLASFCISVSTILLSLVESHSFTDLLFEEVSAFATVGLSRGITSDLTSPGKFIIVVSMFLGRVGILTFMIAFAKKIDTHKYKYPEESIMVS